MGPVVSVLERPTLETSQEIEVSHVEVVGKFLKQSNCVKIILK
jgi:hypothetical protein